jgi:fumarate reductase subunit D
MARSNDPFWWALFAVGGVVAAFLVPIHIVLSGVAAPAGWVRDAFEYRRVLALVSHPISRLYLFAMISLPLFHWAHRFRFVLIDLGLKGGRGPVAIGCYGSAIVGTILTAVVLISL